MERDEKIADGSGHISSFTFLEIVAVLLQVFLTYLKLNTLLTGDEKKDGVMKGLGHYIIVLGYLYSAVVPSPTSFALHAARATHAFSWLISSIPSLIWKY